MDSDSDTDEGKAPARQTLRDLVRAAPGAPAAAPAKPKTKAPTAEKAIKKKSGKKGPREVSSARPVAVKPKSQESTWKVQRGKARDPRFSELSGSFTQEGFTKAYKFLDEYRASEKAMLEAQASEAEKKGRTEDARAIKKELYVRAQQDKFRQRQTDLATAKRELRKEEAAKLASGQKTTAYYPTTRQAVQRVLEKEYKGKEGALEKALAKKRKAAASKARKNMPTRRD